MKPILLLAVAVLVSGCETTSSLGKASTGGAVYEYSRTLADGSECRISITSARDVQGSADLIVGPQCDLTVSAQDLGGSDVWSPVVEKLVDKLPGVP